MPLVDIYYNIGSMVYVAHIGGDFTDCLRIAAGSVVLAAVAVCLGLGSTCFISGCCS
jgi:hypothetical protein